MLGIFLTFSPSSTHGKTSEDEPAPDAESGRETEAPPAEEIDPRIGLPVMADGAPPESQLSAKLFEEGPPPPFAFFRFYRSEPEEVKVSPYPDALCYDDFDDFRYPWRMSGSYWSAHGGVFHGRDSTPFTSPPRATAVFDTTDFTATYRFSLGNSGRLLAVVNGDDGYGNSIPIITISLARTRVTITRGGSTTNSGQADVMRGIVSKKPVKRVGSLYRTNKELAKKSLELPPSWANAEIRFAGENLTVTVGGVEIYSGVSTSHGNAKHGISLVPGPAVVGVDDFLVE